MPKQDYQLSSEQITAIQDAVRRGERVEVLSDKDSIKLVRVRREALIKKNNASAL